MRQIVLDTETTGLDPASGHRIIEIGCVEILNRRVTGDRFHCYVNPEREIDPGAVEVHGIELKMLQDKPRFAEIATEFLQYVQGAEVVIHNAPFDVGFLDYELSLLGSPTRRFGNLCAGVIDTLDLARNLHPGQRNSLDALCKRYAVDNSQRQLHGALLDAEILADVYLVMTGGQVSMALEATRVVPEKQHAVTTRRRDSHPELIVVKPTEAELAAHEQRLLSIDKDSEAGCLWRQLEPG